MAADMSPRASRLPYLFAGVALVLVVGLAWVNRDRFQPVGPGSDAPSFQATSLAGDTVGLASYQGNVVLLNIWATWCPPCREEMPSMERLHRDYEDEGLRVVAVSIDAPPGQTDDFGRPGGDLEAFAERYDLTFTILHDPRGRIQDVYQTTGVPESFVIGKDGVIYKKVSGATEWDAPENRRLIERLLGG